MQSPLRIAVVGSGPAGMYAAAALAESGRATVDVIDRLPAPFGLVRYGVAPDHFSIRSVRDNLDRILDQPGVRFLGNVTVGVDVHVHELQEQYDAVILTYGSSSDRHMGVPGEDLRGCIGATDFVAWYCGHPDADRAFFESWLPTVKHAVVVGLGNVAVDVARVLAKTPAELSTTDMPAHVRATLASANLSDIHIVGRRGPAQATFTTKELKELGELEATGIQVDPAGLDQETGWSTGDRAVARNLEVIRGWMDRPAPSGKILHLHFMARPIEVKGNGSAEAMVVERTHFDAGGQVSGTGELFDIPAEFIVRSIGYRGVGLPGVPFDEATGTVVHAEGRVTHGLYTAGWVKRGPSGIIGTNKKDAVATVHQLFADADAGFVSATGVGEFDSLLSSRGVVPVTTAGWRAIDQAERDLGQEFGIERVTIADRGTMLSIAEQA
ncbi:MAG: FAD-dependent oxidoreductase [Actinomycetota bacterium]|nr:FAD-dependent oxidoreductase [Actinomycetota bacterium]